jgi:hypothetical protein
LIRFSWQTAKCASPFHSHGPLAALTTSPSARWRAAKVITTAPMMTRLEDRTEVRPCPKACPDGLGTDPDRPGVVCRATQSWRKVANCSSLHRSQIRHPTIETGALHRLFPRLIAAILPGMTAYGRIVQRLSFGWQPRCGQCPAGRQAAVSGGRM